MAFRRGYQAELELVDFLTRKGFYAVRAPVSGGRGFPCDVLAAKGEDRRGYEVKVTKEEVLYLYKNDIESFVEFCRKLGFQAFLAVRWKHKMKNPWTFVQIDEAKPVRVSRTSGMSPS